MLLWHFAVSFCCSITTRLLKREFDIIWFAQESPESSAVVHNLTGCQATQVLLQYFQVFSRPSSVNPQVQGYQNSDACLQHLFTHVGWTCESVYIFNITKLWLILKAEMPK